MNKRHFNKILIIDIGYPQDFHLAHTLFPSCILYGQPKGVVKRGSRQNLSQNSIPSTCLIYVLGVQRSMLLVI